MFCISSSQLYIEDVLCDVAKDSTPSQISLMSCTSFYRHFQMSSMIFFVMFVNVGAPLEFKIKLCEFLSSDKHHYFNVYCQVRRIEEVSYFNF